jgi:hypothetical protein
LQVNKPAFLNFGVIDSIDNDKITYNLVKGETGSSSLTYYGTNNEKIPITPYCTNPAVANCTSLPFSNPPRGFWLDSNNGDITFTPVKTNETGILVLESTEFRIDTLGILNWISKTRLESIYTVIDDSGVYNLAPIISGNTNFNACLNETNTFTITIKDEPFKPFVKTFDSVFLNWTIPIRGASVKTSQNSGITTMEITWTPKNEDYRDNPYNFTVQANDNFCPKPLEASKAFTIKTLKGIRLN